MWATRQRRIVAVLHFDPAKRGSPMISRKLALSSPMSPRKFFDKGRRCLRQYRAGSFATLDCPQSCPEKAIVRPSRTILLHRQPTRFAKQGEASWRKLSEVVLDLPGKHLGDFSP
jgi:hypothetical protein